MSHLWFQEYFLLFRCGDLAAVLGLRAGPALPNHRSQLHILMCIKRCASCDRKWSSLISLDFELSRSMVLNIFRSTQWKNSTNHWWVSLKEHLSERMTATLVSACWNERWCGSTWAASPSYMFECHLGWKQKLANKWASKSRLRFRPATKTCQCKSHVDMPRLYLWMICVTICGIIFFL